MSAASISARISGCDYVRAGTLGPFPTCSHVSAAMQRMHSHRDPNGLYASSGPMLALAGSVLSQFRMALSTKLMLRQGQSLVMTPQLLQAIKLLQFSNVELSAFVEEELERNPLLERVDERPDPFAEPASDASDAWGVDSDFDAGDTSRDEGDWASDSMVLDAKSLESDLGTEVSNSFDADRAPSPQETETQMEGAGLSATSWTGTSGSTNGEAPDLEAYVAAQATLQDHLAEQLSLAVSGAVERMIGHALIDAID